MDKLTDTPAVRVHSWSDISEWLEWWLEVPRLSAENQKIFDQYYCSYRGAFSFYLKEYYARQTRELLQFSTAMTHPRILEVGCGCGTETLWFSLQGASVLGVDLSETRLSVARERRELLEKLLQHPVNVEFDNVSLFDINRLEEFDLIWMEQTFHHVEPRNLVPNKLLSLLKPGGYVVISEGNALNPLLQTQFFLQRGFKTIREYTDADGKSHMYGDERITTARKLGRLFVDTGNFELCSVSHFRTLPNMRGVDNLRWMESLVPRWFLPLYTHFNMVLRKKD